jgi:hypothetical protein
MKLIALAILIGIGYVVVNRLDDITDYVEKISTHTEHCTHDH